MHIHWVTVAYLGTMMAYTVYIASNFAGDGDISSQKEAAKAQLHFMSLASIQCKLNKHQLWTHLKCASYIELVYCYTVNLCAP